MNSDQVMVKVGHVGRMIGRSQDQNLDLGRNGFYWQFMGFGLCVLPLCVGIEIGLALTRLVVKVLLGWLINNVH